MPEVDRKKQKPNKQEKPQQFIEEQFHVADHLESRNYFLSFLKTKKI